jgi:hypothetical protein
VVFVGAYGSNVQGTTRSHGHSIPGGVIAGIVVGCIFGVGVLIVLIACCILRGCFASILDLFGMGRRRLKRIDDVNFVERVPRRGFLGLGGRGRSHRSFDSVDSDSYDTSTGSDSSNSIRTTNSRSRATKETRIREIPPAAAEPVAANQKVA